MKLEKNEVFHIENEINERKIMMSIKVQKVNKTSYSLINLITQKTYNSPFTDIEGIILIKTQTGRTWRGVNTYRDIEFKVYKDKEELERKIEKFNFKADLKNCENQLKNLKVKKEELEQREKTLNDVIKDLKKELERFNKDDEFRETE